MDVITFVNVALTLHVRFPFSVTSWMRTPKRNAMVGGHPSSKHMLGTGLDVVLDDTGPVARDAFVAEARKLGLVAVVEDDHIHIQG